MTCLPAVPSLVPRAYAIFASILMAFSAGISRLYAEPPQVPESVMVNPPTIDGKVNDDEWAAAASLDGKYDIDSGELYTQNPTKFWIGYDKHYLYIAARCKDIEPSKVVAVQYRTNVGLRGEDTVQLDIDPTGSLSDFNEFVLNANGASTINLAGGRAAKREWTGEILSKGRVTQDGWEAEARIPWKIMKLPGDGKHDLRFNFARRIPRISRMFTPVFTGSGKGTDTPIWKGVNLPKTELDTSIKLLPYFYTGYDPDDGAVLNSGLDLKTNITDQVQLVGSVNPDFRNIENGILSLDFSRFERLTDESRPFFLEGSDYLGSALFASQRIPSFDFGVNTYGRINDKTNFGFLNTVDFQHSNDGKSGTQNSSVATVTNQLDPHTSVRAAVTSLTGPGLDNSAYLLRVGRDYGPWNITLRDLGSQDKTDGFGREANYELNYQGKNFGIENSYTAVAKNFNPRLGFFPEQDYKGFESNGFYGRDLNKGLLASYGMFGGYSHFLHSDNEPYRRGGYGGFYSALRNGWQFNANANMDQYEGSNDHTYNLNFGFPRGNPYRNANLRFSFGEIGGEAYDSFRLNANYRTLKNLQLNGSYQIVRYAGYSDQLIIGGNFDLDADRSIGGRLVKQGKDINAYLSLRKAGNRGMEYFLILGDPNATKFRSSLILKVSIPFQIGKSS
jgi:Domain of unknown function (DUF5916)/Carbohydrate family 9 binding domain-like